MHATDFRQSMSCMLHQPDIVGPATLHMRLANPRLRRRCGPFAARQEPRPPNSKNVGREYCYHGLLSQPR